MNTTRHTLCYLDKTASTINEQSLEHHELFHYWLHQGYPLIVTRQPAEIVQMGQIQLAIPYFNSVLAKKVRASYLVAESWITRLAELPSLQEIFPQLQLHTDANIKVFGSYCWHYLTKEHYLQPSSDVDVLLTYHNQSLSALATLYHELHSALGLHHIDGEVRFPKLGDCSWYELLQTNSGNSILFKSRNGVTLLSKKNLYDHYPTLLC